MAGHVRNLRSLRVAVLRISIVDERATDSQRSCVRCPANEADTLIYQRTPVRGRLSISATHRFIARISCRGNRICLDTQASAANEKLPFHKASPA